MLTDRQISGFQEIYRKRFDTETSYERALDGGIKLVRLMKLIYKPITQNDFDSLNLDYWTIFTWK